MDHLRLYGKKEYANVMRSTLKLVAALEKQAGKKGVLLRQNYPKNAAFLKESSAPRYAFMHGCLFLAGFSKGKKPEVAVAHIPSGEGTDKPELTRATVESMTKHVGEGAVFVLAGMPAFSPSLREKLFEIIKDELGRHGAELKKQRVSKHGDAANGVVVDAKRKRLHVFYLKKK